MDISKTKRILAHYDISPARLCSEDEEVQEKEVENIEENEIINVQS